MMSTKAVKKNGKKKMSVKGGGYYISPYMLK